MLKKNIKSIVMMKWANSLFPINRSITGAGLRQTINYIKKINKNFKKKKILMGKKFVILKIIIYIFWVTLRKLIKF